MIVMINGAFGAGKTTIAEMLLPLIPNSMIYDPEEVGFMLRKIVTEEIRLEGDSIDILERTVKREIFEEVGIEIKDTVHYVQSTSFVTDKGVNVVDIVFLCEYATGEAYPNSPDEVEQVLWLTYQELMNHPHAPIWPKESIKKAEVVRKNLTGGV